MNTQQPLRRWGRKPFCIPGSWEFHGLLKAHSDAINSALQCCAGRKAEGAIAGLARKFLEVERSKRAIKRLVEDRSRVVLDLRFYDVLSVHIPIDLLTM